MFDEVDMSIWGCVSFGDAKPEEDIVIKEFRGGNNELPYRQYMEALVLLSLQEELFVEHEATMSTWLYNFGLVNELFYQIRTFYTSSDIVKDYQKNLVKKGVIDDPKRTLELSFFKDEYYEQQERLKSILMNLKRKNMIDFYKVPKAQLIVPEETYEKFSYHLKGEVITLETKHVISMNKANLRLREKYGISKQDLNKFSKVKLTKEKKEALEKYHSEYKKYLSGSVLRKSEEEIPYNISRFWYNYAIVVNSTKEEVEKYLNDNKPDFYKEFVRDYSSFVEKMQRSYTEEIKKRLIQNINRKSEKEIEKLKKQLRVTKKTNFSKIEEEPRKLKSHEIVNLIYSWDTRFRRQAKQMVDDMQPDFILRTQ